jgi:hypothetical protein
MPPPGRTKPLRLARYRLLPGDLGDPGWLAEFAVGGTIPSFCLERDADPSAGCAIGDLVVNAGSS